MNEQALEYFRDLAWVATQLGLTDMRWAEKTVRRLITNGFIEPDDFRREVSPKIGRGRPLQAYFLSPVGAMALAMRTQTLQAALWRKAQVGKLLHVAPSLSLPAAPTADVTVLQQAVFELTQRVDALTTTQSAVVERVEKIEARIPEQLQLPMVCEVDNVALHAAFIAAFVKLQDACSASRGLTSTEVFDQIRSSNEAALELREAVKALNGGRVPGSPNPLGKILQRVADSNGALEGQWGHNHARRWVVTANGVH